MKNIRQKEAFLFKCVGRYNKSLQKTKELNKTAKNEIILIGISDRKNNLNDHHTPKNIPEGNESPSHFLFRSH